MSLHELPTERELIDAVVSRIAAAPIEAHPFPHIIVDQLLPVDLYGAVLRTIPQLSEFTVVDYPGTGFGRRGERYHDFGYAYGRFHEARGALGLLYAIFASEQFERALLDKFSRPLPDGLVPIPCEKHEFFSAGAHDYATVFDLQVDLPGYAIAPHKDLRSKIVTFQLYLTHDATLADYGTLLCEPKDARASRGRNRLARLVGRGIRGLPRDKPTLQRAERGLLGAAFRRLERSRLGLTLGVGATVNWLPWTWFDVAKVAHALPNHFLAFAPNDRSYHAVNLDIPPDSPVQERRVVRGFIMSGRNTRNLIRPRAPASAKRGGNSRGLDGRIPF